MSWLDVSVDEWRGDSSEEEPRNDSSWMENCSDICLGISSDDESEDDSLADSREDPSGD